MRPSLLARVDEASALGSLRGRQVNYDPAHAPEDGSPEGHWHVDSGAVLIGHEPPGDPVPDGPWEIARELVTRYEFADERILRAVYDQDQDLLGRDMLLEGRFLFLRFCSACASADVCNGTRGTATAAEPRLSWGCRSLPATWRKPIAGSGCGPRCRRVEFHIHQLLPGRPDVPDPVVDSASACSASVLRGLRCSPPCKGQLCQLVQRGPGASRCQEPASQADGLVLAPQSTPGRALPGDADRGWRGVYRTSSLAP